MVEVETAKDLASLIGQKIGTSEWIEIDQKMINAFADVTNDPMWIHVDVERASREMPDGKTIAHGLLVLSLVALDLVPRGSRRRTLAIAP